MAIIISFVITLIMEKILNSTIHQGLENKEVRDFCAISSAQITKKMAEINTNHSIKATQNEQLKLTTWAIANWEREVKFSTEMLNYWNQRKAIELILEMNGWHRFDVSNEQNMVQDPLCEFWLEFIGTNDEYQAFLEKYNLF